MQQQSSRSFSQRSSHGGSRPSYGASRGGQGPRGRGYHAYRPMRRQPRPLDSRLFIRRAVDVPQEIFVPKNMFADFNLVDQLKHNIAVHGYKAPTPIQDQAIPQLLEGRDMVGVANTGTGKTAAFLIPLINKVFLDRNQRVLIICPTRELAVQIEQEFRHFAQNMSMHAAVCIGGMGMFGQIEKMRRRPNFVIGTPGRLRDLERQHALNFAHYNNIVLDEVDQMLDMGFIHEVKYITALLPKTRQSLFFSATLPDEAQRLMKSFLHNPISISVKTRPTSDNVDQDVVRIAGRDKVTVLQDLLKQEGFEKVLIFLRTKRGVERLADALDRRGFRLAVIHGNKSQGQRQRAIDDFKRNRVSILLATDVASRGLDIDRVTHVINYDLPETFEDYTHRIGRTGRANKKGVALTFVD